MKMLLRVGLAVATLGVASRLEAADEVASSSGPFSDLGRIVFNGWAPVGTNGGGNHVFTLSYTGYNDTDVMPVGNPANKDATGFLVSGIRSVGVPSQGSIAGGYNFFANLTGTDRGVNLYDVGISRAASPFNAGPGEDKDWNLDITLPPGWQYGVAETTGKINLEGLGPQLFETQTLSLLAPEPASLRLVLESGGAFDFSISNLAIGASNTLDRTLDLFDTNGWQTVTSFVSNASSTNLQDGTSNAWLRAYYRLSSE